MLRSKCYQVSLACIKPIMFLLNSNQFFVCLFSDHLFSPIPLPRIILAPYKQSVDLVIRCAVQNQSKYCWCCQPFHVCVMCFWGRPRPQQPDPTLEHNQLRERDTGFLSLAVAGSTPHLSSVLFTLGNGEKICWMRRFSCA